MNPSYDPKKEVEDLPEEVELDTNRNVVELAKPERKKRGQDFGQYRPSLNA